MTGNDVARIITAVWLISMIVCGVCRMTGNKAFKSGDEITYFFPVANTIMAIKYIVKVIILAIKS